jgi:hypothetical protein
MRSKVTSRQLLDLTFDSGSKNRNEFELWSRLHPFLVYLYSQTTLIVRPMDIITLNNIIVSDAVTLPILNGTVLSTSAELVIR